jgi:hypothetical protein
MRGLQERVPRIKCDRNGESRMACSDKIYGAQADEQELE